MAASLSVTVLFHNLLPPDLQPEASLSAAHCVNTCYYNRTCASVFYDRSLHLCYQSDLWFDEVVPGLMSQPDVSYITFVRSDCPRNWTYHKPTGKCFFAGDDTTNSKAIAFCTSYGGRLFNIYSAEEDRIPITLAIRHDAMFWIGLLREGSRWYWHKGSEVGYTNWMVDTATGRCTKHGGSELIWRVSGCNRKKHILCEVVLIANYCSL